MWLPPPRPSPARAGEGEDGAFFLLPLAGEGGAQRRMGEAKSDVMCGCPHPGPPPQGRERGKKRYTFRPRFPLSDSFSVRNASSTSTRAGRGPPGGVTR